MTSASVGRLRPLSAVHAGTRRVPRSARKVVIFRKIVYDFAQRGLNHRVRTVHEMHDELCLAAAHRARYDRREWMSERPHDYALFVVVVVVAIFIVVSACTTTTTPSLVCITLLFAYTQSIPEWGPPGSARRRNNQTSPTRMSYLP